MFSNMIEKLFFKANHDNNDNENATKQIVSWISGTMADVKSGTWAKFCVVWETQTTATNFSYFHLVLIAVISAYLA